MTDLADRRQPKTDNSRHNFSIPPGTCVAIVAPGGYAPDNAAVKQGIALLEAQACRVKNYYQHDARYLRFGGTDEARAAQLHAAAADPEVDIVLALRGSYGMSRLLGLLDWQALADSGKLFVGYSDLTALHLGLLAKTGAISFAGPMLCGDFGGDNPCAWTLRHFWQVMTQPSHVIDVAGVHPEVEAEGVLWGGNLAVLVHLLGTPYFPQIDGGILFVEDVNEHPYRIERMMLQLLHAGVLARQKAVLFGDFSNYRLSEYDNGYDFNATLAYLRSVSPAPILTGLPFGHIADRVTLAVGAQAQLRSGTDGFSLKMSGYPYLKP
ncbi:muramoyltetrapeptide carboxypeptidase [Herbaspirillum sp. RTI4]|uniref:muramoyltetrapeptide carboxypeptidase n=1 Tax=Herbaspirillum sp. RTI4 TaxID=3048640 RepID=UPI002AB37B9C|nr:muramoyltetrapeptide carboxypeptidase [Herbaspirillum sp. RTI4]MDY7578815.1 muramoyltetrapeptide carboxypeptidase [Herbaspirillum sp. RTI4]MEA9982669.1 muramoyltetrapeptide carboxypeptidase [Herbaspirillum sp. RTI4]